MNWSQFLLWVLIAYLVYYTINIVYDLFLSKDSQQGDDEHLYELMEEEKIIPINVEDLAPSKKKSKPITPIKNINETSETDESFVQTESTGGMSIKSLFRQYAGRAGSDADSIIWE